MGLDAISSEARQEITTKKPETVDPYGGINIQSQLTRDQCGLAAMRRKGVGYVATHCVE